MRGECLEGEKRFSIKREKWKRNQISRELYIEKKKNSMDRGAIKIYWALNLDRCELIKVLSRICRRKKYLDGSTSYRESINQTEVARWIKKAIEHLLRQSQEISMDWDCVHFCRDKKKKGLINTNLSRICQGAVELEEKEVFKKKKKKNTKRWMQQASNSNIDPINMWSSQKHLSTKKMQSIHDPKHTHTHTQQV